MNGVESASGCVLDFAVALEDDGELDGIGRYHGVKSIWPGVEGFVDGVSFDGSEETHSVITGSGRHEFSYVVAGVVDAFVQGQDAGGVRWEVENLDLEG